MICIIEKPAKDVPHEGEHQFTYRPAKVRYSSYYAKGRETSYEGRSAGREAANRANISGNRPSMNSGS